jgi:timeless
LIWILRRDNLDSHEYRRYIGHKKVLQTDLLPILIHYHDNAELSDVLLRLLVNLMSPPILFFREDLPKDGAGRRTYLDLMEIAHTYKEAFSSNAEVWKSLAKRLQRILEIEVGLRSEEQNLVFERVLVLMRNVLQVPTNPTDEKRVDNDVNIHDKVLWTLHESGMFDFILYILSSEYENQFQLHALEVTFLMFREQKVETLALASVQRSEAEKQADEAALINARQIEKSKFKQNIKPARHSRFGGTYVYQNMKSVSDLDLICHLPLERVVQRDLNHDKQKAKANFRLAKDEEKYERQSAFFIRLCMREFCIEILNSAFNNLVRQVRRVLERNSNFGETQNGGHDQSYLLWAIRFFLEFNRLNGFKLHLVTEALSTGCIHWIQNQIQHDSEMIQTDKKMKVKWNRRLQLGIQAYREFLKSIHAMENIEDDDTQHLLKKLRMNIFYVVEYREIILQLLLSYNENSFTK